MVLGLFWNLSSPVCVSLTKIKLLNTLFAELSFRLELIRVWPLVTCVFFHDPVAQK